MDPLVIWRIVNVVLTICALMWLMLDLRVTYTELSKRRLYLTVSLAGYILAVCIVSISNIFQKNPPFIQTGMITAASVWCLLGLWATRDEDEERGIMQLSEKNYNLAKWFVTIFLPAFGALYAGMSQLFPLPNALGVVGAASLLAVFLGAILGISNANYKKEVAKAEDANVSNAGYINVTGANGDTGLPDVQLTMTKDPTDFVGKDTVTLKVGQPPVPPA